MHAPVASFYQPMRAIPILLVLALGHARPAGALTLDLPVRAPGRANSVPGPAYRGDLLEIRLAPAAARTPVKRGGSASPIPSIGGRGVRRYRSMRRATDLTPASAPP